MGVEEVERGAFNIFTALTANAISISSMPIKVNLPPKQMQGAPQHRHFCFKVIESLMTEMPDSESSRKKTYDRWAIGVGCSKQQEAQRKTVSYHGRSGVPDNGKCR